MPTATAKYNAVARGFSALWNTQIARYNQFWPQVSTLVRSVGADEAYVWLEAVPGMKEFLGDRVFQQLRSSSYTITNKVWEQSVAVDRHSIDDDRYGMYAMAMSLMAQKAATHPDQLIVELLANGHATQCYDNQYYYDTDHVTGSSGSQSNDLTYAAASGTTPTVEEFRAAFQAALIAMLGFKDDRGDYFVQAELLDPGSLMVCVPPALWQTAVRAMEEVITVSGSAGVSNVMVAKAQIKALQRLSTAAGAADGDAVFHLLYTGGPVRPLVFQLRDPLRMEPKGSDTIETKTIKFMSEARYNAGYGLWQYAVRTQFT